MNNPTTAGSYEAPAYPVQVNIKTMLDAGAHFGHQTHRWNPKMLPFIFGARNDIHIINLDNTMKLWERARKYVVDTMSRGGSILFVGTKQQARECVRHEAARAGALHVTTRWLGGTLSNFQTLKASIDRMRKMEDLLKQAEDPESKIHLAKKEKVMIGKELFKLEANLGGIRAMKKLPELVFVVDVIKEQIAVSEARRLHIPVVALVDTNVDPAMVDFPIPSNDDAARTIRLFVAAMADAVLEGRAQYEARRAKDDKGKDEQNGGRAKATQSQSAENTAAASA
ncbi:MAG: 30S ribosomal protein S2 [Deltaproteobacteria bacterium]|nr:30S ribosomal protein S2 [Deltaproteobacteria bacterium]